MVYSPFIESVKELSSKGAIAPVCTGQPCDRLYETRRRRPEHTASVAVCSVTAPKPCRWAIAQAVMRSRPRSSSCLLDFALPLRLAGEDKLRFPSIIPSRPPKTPESSSASVDNRFKLAILLREILQPLGRGLSGDHGTSYYIFSTSAPSH